MAKLGPYQEKMPQGETKKKETSAEQEHSLRGTFASVMILGFIIGVSWLGIFILFMMRN